MKMNAENANIRVIRITLPHYEITYPSVNRALVDAKIILKEQRLVVPRAFPEKVQDSIVIDLTVQNLAFTTTLLFRLDAVVPTHSTFSWWARRKTDTDLLRLWIRTLESELQTTSKTALSKRELRVLLSLCRRTLSRNPFEALNIHWSANGSKIQKAIRETKEQLVKYKKTGQLDTDTRTLLDRSLLNISELTDQLSSIHMRRLLRKRFVPKGQLNHARQLAREKLVIAKMRTVRKDIEEAISELAELVEP